MWKDFWNVKPGDWKDAFAKMGMELVLAILFIAGYYLLSGSSESVIVVIPLDPP